MTMEVEGEEADRGEADGYQPSSTSVPGSKLPSDHEADDEAPDPKVIEHETALALATAAQGLGEAVNAVYSKDPEAEAARKKLKDKYDQETKKGPPPGKVREVFDNALELFQSAAHALLHSHAGDQPSLEAWITAQLASNVPYPHDPRTLYGILFDGYQVEKRLKAHKGPRERALAKAAAATDLWETWFKDWSDPSAAILARIGDSAGDLAAIHSDLAARTNVDYAIYRLFFEVAPRLVAVWEDRLPDDAGDAIELVRKALTGFHKLERSLTPPSKRTDYGGVYFTKGDPNENRKKVVEDWRRAAHAEAAAMAASKLQPDDSQSLNGKLEKLKQTQGDLAKALLSDPVPTP